MSHNSLQFSRWQIIKNLTVICAGFALLFTAYNGLSMLQSTINQSQGIGVISQAITYVGFGISALLLPKYTIKKIGCKNALLISMALYLPYIAANFFFNWITVVPSALMVGLAASMLWSSQCTYFNLAATLYSQLLVIGKTDASPPHTNNLAKPQNGTVGAEKSNLEQSLEGKKLSEVHECQTEIITDRQTFPCREICLNKSDLSNSSACCKDSTKNEANHKNFESKTELLKLDGSETEVTVLTMTGALDTLERNCYLNAASSSEELENENKEASKNQTQCSGPSNSVQHINFVNKYRINRVYIEDVNYFEEKDEIESTSDYPADFKLPDLNSYCETDSVSKVQKVDVNKRFSVQQNEEYARTVSSTTARFFGFFGLTFRSSDIWSNLISYYILNDGRTLDNITEDSNCICGAAFCGDQSNCFENNLAEPSQEMKNVLTGVYITLAVLAILVIVLFLDELEKDRQPISFSFNLAMATCKLVRQKEAVFLIPLSVYIGLQQGFYIGDFTKSYIACAWGVYHIGLVTIAYGLSAGLSSTVAGLLVKYIGRIPVIVAGGIINAAVNVFLLLWNPLPEQTYLFFFAAASWGVSVGIFWSQLRAFYGVVFGKDTEAAYGGFYLWDAVGYCAAFAYSNYICTYIKLYILLAVSTIGTVGYLKTESLHSLNSKI